MFSSFVLKQKVFVIFSSLLFKRKIFKPKKCSLCLLRFAFVGPHFLSTQCYQTNTTTKTEFCWLLFPVLLATTFLLLSGPDSKIWIWARSWSSKVLRTQKHLQIRLLGDTNPMDDAPDQDSAKIPEIKVWTLFGLPDQSWVFRFGDPHT